MEAVIEKECSALGGLFQTTIGDMKVRGKGGGLKQPPRHPSPSWARRLRNPTGLAYYGGWEEGITPPPRSVACRCNDCIARSCLALAAAASGMLD